MIDLKKEHFKQKCFCIFSDISKAFDMVPIPLLLSKLQIWAFLGYQTQYFQILLISIQIHPDCKSRKFV